MVAGIIALILNVAAFFYLKSWRPVISFIRTHAAAYRGQRQIQAFRVAGMLMVLVAIAHGQRVETWKGDKRCPGCTGGIVYGVQRDADYEAAVSIAKANGVDVSAWAYPEYSHGDDKLQTKQPDAFDQMVWNNWYWFVGGAVAIFLFLQFGGGKESNDTNINDLADPDYRTAFVSNYHGDDAFEVPNGMQSEYQPVPVRSRSASAGR